MQPQNRTLHITQPGMQPIAIPEVDCRHANSPPALVAVIVFTNGLAPEIASLGRACFLAKANVDEEVAVCVARLEVGSWAVDCRPGGYAGGKQGRRVPAVELTCGFAFRVHGCAQGDDTGDL